MSAAVVLAPLAVAAGGVALHRAVGDVARSRVRDRIGRERSGPPPAFANWWIRRGLVGPDAAWTAVVVVAAISVGLLALNPVAAASVALGSAVAAAAAERAWLQRQRHLRRSQLAPALDTIASSLRAGRSMTVAIGDAAVVGAPLGPELVGIAAAATRGAPLQRVLVRWAADADTDTRTVAAAIAVGADVGGPVARAIDAAAASLRDQQSLQREAIALATQARASAAVLSLAPVAFAVVLAGSDDRTLGFFIDSPVGVLCLSSGLGLDALGAWWMQRMVRTAVDIPPARPTRAAPDEVVA